MHPYAYAKSDRSLLALTGEISLRTIIDPDTDDMLIGIGIPDDVFDAATNSELWMRLIFSGDLRIFCAPASRPPNLPPVALLGARYPVR